MRNLVAGRSGREAAIAAGATWLALCVAMGLALPQPPNLVHWILGALAGALLIAIGFRAGASWRSRATRRPVQRLRLLALSVLAGAALGGLALWLLVLLPPREPLLRARFAGRLGEPQWRPAALGFESAVLEEVVFRLFAMGVIVWLAMRLLKRPGPAVSLGIAVSALLFGLAHLPGWSSAAHLTAPLVAGVLLLNGLGGALFGWVFWRWGLPYAMACHFAADIVVQTLAPRFLQ
jgi:hypothetical protein